MDGKVKQDLGLNVVLLNSLLTVDSLSTHYRADGSV